MILTEKRVVIWGAKSRGMQIDDFMKNKMKVTVEFFIDNDPRLIGTTIN